MIMRPNGQEFYVKFGMAHKESVCDVSVILVYPYLSTCVMTIQHNYVISFHCLYEFWLIENGFQFDGS